MVMTNTLFCNNLLSTAHYLLLRHFLILRSYAVLRQTRYRKITFNMCTGENMHLGPIQQTLVAGGKYYIKYCNWNTLFYITIQQYIIYQNVKDVIKVSFVIFFKRLVYYMRK